MSNPTGMPDDTVLAMKAQRDRAKAMKLPLSTPLAEIERVERAKTFPFTGDERPGPVRKRVECSQRCEQDGHSVHAAESVQPDCVCSHPAALHDFERRCTVCRCRRYRSREAQHVAAGVRLMTGVGFRHVNYSSTAKSKIHVGHPDHLFLHPVRGLRVFWEAKGDDGTPTEEQLAFQVLAEASGIPCVIGRVAELRAWLTRTLEAAQ